MHLSHQLPWNGVGSHLRFVKEHTAVYGRPTGLFPRDDARQDTDLQHFVNVFAATIADFAEVERRKYPTRVKAADTLYPKEVADAARHGLQPFEANNNRCIPLSPKMQHLSYWEQRAEERYSTGDGDLSDAVKFLLQQDQSEALLALSQAVPLSSLFFLSWGHSFGVSHVAQDTLQLYILLNLAYTVQQEQLCKAQSASGTSQPQVFRIFDMDALRRMVLECFNDYDYSAQNIMHYQFWIPYVQNVTEREHAVFKDPAEVDPSALKAYLARCFRVLYLYEMMRRECGETDSKEFWVSEVQFALQRAVSSLHLPEA